MCSQLSSHETRFQNQLVSVDSIYSWLFKPSHILLYIQSVPTLFFKGDPAFQAVQLTHTLFISNFSLCATVSAPRWQSVVYVWVLFIFPPRPNRDDSLVLMSTSLMQSRIKWIPLGAGVVQAHSEWLGCRSVSLGSNKFVISSYLSRRHVDLGGEKREGRSDFIFLLLKDKQRRRFLCFLMHLRLL